VKRGLGRTFQINALFRRLAVIDTWRWRWRSAVAVARRMLRAQAHMPMCAPRAWTCSPRSASPRTQAFASANCLRQTAALSRFAIALGLKPRVLLLDEPAAGVPSLESHRILQVLDNLPKHIAILIIEHDMDLVFRFARRITVLDAGRGAGRGAA